MLSEKVSHITLLGNADHPVSSKNRLQSLAAEIIALAVTRRNAGEYQGLSQWIEKTAQRLAQDGSEQGIAYLNDLEPGEDLDLDKLDEICTYLQMVNPLTLSIDIDRDLKSCDLIVAASNSPEYLIFPRHLKPGSIVCDVARPADISPEVYAARNDVLILEGGLVQFPDQIRFGPNLGYRDGVNMACLAETVLLALEGDYQDYSIGMKLPLDTVEYFRYLGKKHGFSLAGLMMGNREITEQDIKDIFHCSLDIEHARDA